MSAHAWIPVEGALPGDQERVLISVEGRSFWVAYLEAGRWFFANGKEVIGEVTHWTVVPKTREGILGDG